MHDIGHQDSVIMGIESPEPSGKRTRKGEIDDAIARRVDAGGSGRFHVLPDGLERQSHMGSHNPPQHNIGDQEHHKNDIEIWKV